MYKEQAMGRNYQKSQLVKKKGIRIKGKWTTKRL